MQNDHSSAPKTQAKSEMPDQRSAIHQPAHNSNPPRKIIWVTLAALVGGLVGGIGIINFRDLFPDTEEAVEIFLQEERTDEQQARVEELTAARWRKNAIASYAFCGSLIAGCTAMASGAVSHSKSGAIAGLGAGIVLGAIGGGVGAVLNVWTYETMVANHFSQLRIGMWTQLAAFIPIGLCTGIAASLSTKASATLLRSALLGAVGAFLAGFLYAPVTSILFPHDKIALPIPSGKASMLAWGVMPAVIIGALIGNDSVGKSEQNEPKQGLNSGVSE